MEKFKQINHPTSVFIDSQVFLSEACNFNEGGVFFNLKKQVDNGFVRFLTSKIVKSEVKGHLRKNVSEMFMKIDENLKDRKLAVLRESKCLKDISKHLEGTSKSTMADEAIAVFDDYLLSVKAEDLDTKTINIDRILDDYFTGNPPFGENKKKHEFPDAFNISMVEAYSAKNGDVLVVSGDDDYANVDGIHVYKTLASMLDKVNFDQSKSGINQQVKDYLNTKTQDVFEEVKTMLMDEAFGFRVDGTTSDHDHTCFGFEYDETELQSVEVKNLFDINVVDIDEAENLITIMAECDVTFDFNCYFFDEENSFWDGVDKEYVYECYGKNNEIHNAKVQITLSISFDELDDDYYFDLENVDIDRDIEFNEFTLEEDRRERIDVGRPWEHDDLL